MSRTQDPFAKAEMTANHWLAVVRDELDLEDTMTAYRMLRAWLYTVRDRMPIEAAAHFAAQLPELLRGVFFEGWKPSRVPELYDVPVFIERFAAEAGIHRGQVPRAANAVTTALEELCSPGQLEHVLALMPRGLRDLLSGGAHVG